MPKTYLELMRERLEGQERNVPGHLGNKDNVRKFAKMLGIRVPKLYYEGPLFGVPWADLPEYFALKPRFASTSIGVFLVRIGTDGSMVDLATSEPVTRQQIIDKELSVLQRYNLDPANGMFLVEELLIDYDGSTPPPDIRVYSFFGELGMVYIDYHRPGQKAISAYFDGDFNQFPDLDERYRIAEEAKGWQEISNSLPKPPRAELVLNLAKRLTLAVPSAFCRFDFYDTPKGVYLGEITFFPGAFYYENVKLMLPKEDRRLGQLWESALERLDDFGVQ